jgi:hypothetical protein
VLAETGRIQYNGWSTAMLGWQLYLGAFFIKLFGFSFFAVRLAMLIVSMITIIIVHRLFARFGLTERNATVATLTIALSPLFMPLAWSFMSDVPGFSCIILCLYMCVRSVQAKTDSAAMSWIALAAFTNVILGTVRQTGWLGTLVIIPSAIWYMRRRHGVLRVGIVSCLIGSIFIVACMRWFSLQPYALVEKIITTNTTPVALLAHMVGAMVRIVLSCSLFALPVLAAFVWKYPLYLQRARKQLFLSATLLLVTIFCLALLKPTVLWFWLLPLGNVVDARGVMDVPGILGHKPEVLTVTARILLTTAAVSGLEAYGICWFNK